MKIRKCFFTLSVGWVPLIFLFSAALAQEQKVDRIRIGGGSASATQMSMWLAKEGNFYTKNGLDVEAISIPGSSLALQAMLAGELSIIQLGGAASIQANLAGGTPSSSQPSCASFSSGYTASRVLAGWKN